MAVSKSLTTANSSYGSGEVKRPESNEHETGEFAIETQDLGDE